MKQRLLIWTIMGAVWSAQPLPAAAQRLADFLQAANQPRSGADLSAPSQPSRASAGAPKIVDPQRALETHGVNGASKDLIAFLERGISKDKVGRLPKEPTEKCQLAIDAMARLAKARSRESVPVLIQIASTQLPQGVELLLDIDLGKTSPESRPEYRETALRLLQFNAVNALGLIGDPQGGEIVRAVFARETNPAARIQHALSMGCLGDPAGLDFLIEQIELLNRRESAAAARVFTMVTGQDFGYTENTALRARRPKARQYREWWKQNRAQFAVNPDEVIKRRLEPKTPLAYQPRTPRDLLKLAACYFDFDNSLGSKDARKRIKDSGPAMNSELQRLASDPMEDLDVRMEAMNWYYEINRTDARNLMTKLRRDENSEIVDKAVTLLEQIEDKTSAAPMTIRR